MSAGRGEFFRSFLEGLERRPKQADSAGLKPGVMRRKPDPGGGQAAGNRWTRQLKAAPTPFSGNHRSWPKPKTERKKVTPQENFIERLPTEILFKILSYLDASSLFCIGHVSRLFHWLANDDAVWHEIYMSEFGCQTWRPKAKWHDVALKVDPVEDRSPGHWKKLYFRTVTGQEMNKWRRELRDINPYTGLPRHTQWVLRNMNTSWELMVSDRKGYKIMLEQSRTSFFNSSIIICWSVGSFLHYRHISCIRLHGVRKETLQSLRRPGWRSLVLKLDVKAQPVRSMGRDRLVKLMHLSPGVIVGVWRGQDSVAFIMVSLHFHRLVERSLLGSPVCPYSEPVYNPPVDDLDPDFGLHSYTLNIVLHNTSTEIMSGHFGQLFCRAGQIQGGQLELRVIDRTNLSQHRSLSGSIKLPWKSGALEGSVENCCILTLTLLDEFQKPFWCVSTPICITMAKNKPSFDYSGEHFQMDYRSPEGQVKMKLVWLKEQKQFFLISLSVYVPVFKVNKYFSRNY